MLSDPEEVAEFDRKVWEGLNAPFGARCFLTQRTAITPRVQRTDRLNAPFGAGHGWFLKNVARNYRPVVSMFEVGSLKFCDF